MAQVLLLPNGINASETGNWSVSSVALPTTLNDGNDSTLCNNAVQNQSMFLLLDDFDGNLQSTTSIQLTVRAKAGSKGSSTFTAEIVKESSGEVIVSNNHTAETTNFDDYAGTIENISGENETFVNNLAVKITTTDGTQGFFSEVTVQLIYVEIGKISLNTGKISLNTGKIIIS
jgi:hypothetical protein